MVVFGGGWPVQYDSRGHKLEDYEFHRAKVKGAPEKGECDWLTIRAHPDIAAIVAAELNGCRKIGNVKDIDVKWTHGWRLVGPLKPVRKLCIMLTETLTLVKEPELDYATAGDWYKVPPDDDDGEWTDTHCGGLVHKAKYYVYSPGRQASALRELAEYQRAIIRRHPGMRDADAIALTPSTNTGVSEKLGEAVADLLELPTVCPRRLDTPTAAAKDGHVSFDLIPYEFDEDLSGRRIVIVDDVYKSGRTMRSIAAAARNSGATAVSGVAGARTMTRR